MDMNIFETLADLQRDLHAIQTLAGNLNTKLTSVIGSLYQQQAPYQMARVQGLHRDINAAVGETTLGDAPAEYMMKHAEELRPAPRGEDAIQKLLGAVNSLREMPLLKEMNQTVTAPKSVEEAPVPVSQPKVQIDQILQDVVLKWVSPILFQNGRGSLDTTPGNPDQLPELTRWAPHQSRTGVFFTHENGTVALLVSVRDVITFSAVANMVNFRHVDLLKDASSKPAITIFDRNMDYNLDEMVKKVDEHFQCFIGKCAEKISDPRPQVTLGMESLLEEYFGGCFDVSRNDYLRTRPVIPAAEVQDLTLKYCEGGVYLAGENTILLCVPYTLIFVAGLQSTLPSIVDINPTLTLDEVLANARVFLREHLLRNSGQEQDVDFVKNISQIANAAEQMIGQYFGNGDPLAAQVRIDQLPVVMGDMSQPKVSFHCPVGISLLGKEKLITVNIRDVVLFTAEALKNDIGYQVKVHYLNPELTADDVVEIIGKYLLDRLGEIPA